MKSTCIVCGNKFDISKEYLEKALTLRVISGTVLCPEHISVHTADLSPDTQKKLLSIMTTQKPRLLEKLEEMGYRAKDQEVHEEGFNYWEAPGETPRDEQ